MTWFTEYIPIIFWIFISLSIWIWLIINHYRRKTKERLECLETGYHRIIGNQHVDIAKEFLKKEYSDLFKISRNSDCSILVNTKTCLLKPNS